MSLWTSHCLHTFSVTFARSAPALPTWARASSTRSSMKGSSCKCWKFATSQHRKQMRAQRRHRNCSRFSSPMASIHSRPSRWSRRIFQSTRNLEQKWEFCQVFFFYSSRVCCCVEKSLQNIHSWKCQWPFAMLFSHLLTFSHYAFILVLCTYFSPMNSHVSQFPLSDRSQS